MRNPRLGVHALPRIAARVFAPALCLAACGSPTISDAGAPSDVGAPDAGASTWRTLAVGTIADPADPEAVGPDAMPPDMSCLGVWSIPMPGTPRDVEVHLVDVVMPTHDLQDACVHVATSNHLDPAEACLPTDPRTDTSGRFSVPIAGAAPFALHVFAADQVVETLIFDTTTTGAGVDTVYASPTARGLIPAFWHRDVVPGAALIGARAVDCQFRPLFGVRFQLARSDGSYVAPGEGATDPFAFYFAADGTPAPGRDSTHVRGNGGIGNVPVRTPGEPIFLEGWGLLPGASTPSLVSCASLEILADAATFDVNVVPLLADGPSCPGTSPPR
jgi:hypothetical protein